MTNSKELVVGKEKFTEYRSNKSRYYSVTNGYNGYFEGSDIQTALSQVKEYAKLNGFTTLKILGNKWNQKDKIYTIK